jgi:hypothetical protein
MYTVGNQILSSETQDMNLSERTMRQRVDFGILGAIPVDSAETSQGVLAVDVHGAASTDTLPAGSSESECRVHFILNLDQCVQNHRPCLVEVDLVGLQGGLLLRLVWVPAVDFELLHKDWLLGRHGPGERGCSVDSASGQRLHRIERRGG